MPEKTLELTDTDFLRRLERSSVRGVFNVRIHGGIIPVQVIPRKAPVLLVVFAGAINRETRALPRFGGQFLRSYLPASVLGIADPSLPRSPIMQTAWYGGHEGFETQQILPEFLQRVAAACGAERVVFLGGSAGGFAALYYSWCAPGSVAVTFNPQTDLDRYNIRHITTYRECCRPSLSKDEPLSTVIRSSLPICYAERFENTVVYLQNASDAGHVRNHFAPFLAAIEVSNQKRLLARLGYWGSDGHAPPPTQEWLAWVKAAMTSPSASAADIQRTRNEHASRQTELADLYADFSDRRLAEVIVNQARSQRDQETAPPLVQDRH